jgi:hypothetical protein
LNISEEYLTSLRDQLEVAYDKKIERHGDCIGLQGHILLSVEKKIAISSIRRLFKQVKYEGGFSCQTVKVLEDFIRYHQTKRNNNEYAYSANWLLQVLENAPSRKINNPFIVQFIRSFYAVQISNHLAIDPLFMRDLAHSAIGRRVFYDQFVHLDGLNGSYGEGMEHYLEAETIVEHRAFALCLLTLREYLYRSKKKAQAYYQMLPEWSPQFHPFIQGRIRALQILLEDRKLRPNDFQKWVMEDMKHQVIINKNYRGFPAYELMILESLWRTRDFENGLWLTVQTLEKWSAYWNLKTGMDKGYYQVLKSLMLNFSMGCKSTFQRVAKLNASDEMPKLAEKFYISLLA